ncbi:unnamed protein product [Clonostachys byssicola]|uniref:Uncharacterized protein n=1 Tax=Clonostachys byssicola TaxID=160290 RepID=A0A9N9XZI3_9HYPO|nr:unnamed protein product [Clonostachys byssicola]
MERSGEPVAIIGTSCRFPGDSTTPSKFWELLREPHDLLKPHRRGFDSESWYSENGKHHGRFNVKQAYQLDGENTHSQFDAPFFGISAVEANTMDPQMRLLLETVYEALEAGGQSMERLRGSDTAVYTDTACSSSMVAVHQAVMQLRTGQSHVAVAAGANLILDPADYIGMSNLDMLSPDSRSRMWDANANGYARGEGVAAVVLKLLSAAEADGDHIECIIRETAINQDGRTKGITMSVSPPKRWIGRHRPSSTAQAQLISDCYARAGLDLLDPTQRPQYFEAHGTGTPAGDPIEAEAIKEAFFPIVNNNAAHAPEKLFVGSVKTVIGHSESVAGLAALIKTSLALQNSLIPPNLLLQDINPKVLPFYGNLQIPSTAVPWPRVPDGCPRRASVNSFGFGGANSHAIVESYIPNLTMTGNGQICCIPFVFSAASTVSLAAILANTRRYLMSNTDDVSLRDLALTMYLRRSRHAYGIAIAASSLTELCQKLEKSCYDLTADGGTSTSIRSSTQLSSGHHRKPRILAIFTGQGAQCSRMGAAFIERSVYCRDIVDRLEARLASLPEKDRPSWSLRQELLEAPAARINKASISQPLCTALQIMQVELMRRANVDFSAVVGHSSGEISAAYCAGMITADEAICIAYYRGLISERASHAQPKRGAMIAVATTLPDAQELCEDDDFKDRVCVAAVNSPTGITLSGDSDAVEHLHTIFKDEGKLVRSLQVDQAYHSFHMETCAEEYVRALEALNIEPKLTETSWFSSVDGGTQVGTGYLVRLRSTYWGDNMVQPVMFMQAIDRAWKSCGPFDMAVELGPHPALKRPALETMQELHGQKIPYTGVHARGKDAVEAFADALGLLWAHVAYANLTQYDRYVTGQADYIPVVGLPPYAWDHPKQYWHESRYAKAIRTQPGPSHELLGHLTPDSNDKDMKWRKVLCPDEVPWLKNHAIEGQAIFPAAGYVVLAVEATAAMVKAKGLLVSLIDVRDLDIGKALAFGSADTRMELVVSLNIIHQNDHTITTSFHLHAAPILSDGSLNLLASGSTTATLGDSNPDVLPSTRCLQTGLSNINYEDYYQSLSSLGYDYAEQFRALRGLKRKFGFASGSIQVERSAMLVHPAVLDASFQSMFLANCAPHTGGIWALHVPKTIRLVRVNPSVCAAANGNNTVSVECTQPKDVPGFECDVDIFSMDGDLERCMIQVQGLSCVPLTRPTVADDREMFATVVWDVAVPDGNRVTFDGQPTEHKIQLASLLERLSVFYLKTLCINVPEQHPSRQTDPYQHYFNFASHILSQAKEGTLPYWSSKWTNDSYDDVRAASEAFLEYPDVQLLQAIGENIVDIATGKTLAIEIGMRNDMLARIYEFGLGFQEYSIFLGRLVKQIAHRHPGMNIIEVGAGTGVATKRVFSEIGKTFSSYTFTDISSGFFERAKGLFSSHQSAMLYKVLDISRDVASQGFDEHSYDMVVVSAVLHATPDLRVTLSNVRRLLKPGGFLVAVEGQPTSAMLGTIFGSLPGWWLGANDGRRLSPCVDLPTWDTLLRATGFSGCDTKIQSAGDAAMPMTAFVSQAVDDRVNFVRHPSSTPMALFQGDNLRREEELLILGSRVAQSLLPLLQSQWGNRIRTVDSLAALDISLVGSNTTILSLLDLDTPLFGNLQSDTWVALRTCLQQANTILWVSSNRRCENPDANMMIGLLRSVKHEIPTIAIQSLDFESPALPSAQRIADALVAFKAALMWQQDGNMLSTIEPEIVIDTDGTPVIPRMKPDQTMNNRYNSPRRPVFSNSSCHRGNGNIALAGFDGTLPSWQQHAVPPPTPKFTIQVTRSLRSALYIPKVGFMNLVLGRNPESDEQVVALTTQPTLHVIPVVTVALPMPVPAAQEAAFLSLLAYQLISKLLASEVSFGTTVVVHNKEEEPLISILRDTSERNVLSLKIGLSPHNNYIHPMTPDRKLRQMIPSDTSVFCDLSIGQSGSAAGARFRAHLPSNCRVYDRSSIFAVPCSSEFPHAQQSAYLVALLRDCVSRCHAETAPFSALSYADGGHLLETVKWPAHASDVQVRVRPADSYVQFSTNRTYWLCGLSGGLGLLLCEWMIDRGATHVVISSRSPKVEEQWLVRMRNLGADVRIFACDITDRAAVQGLYRQIKSSLPQVAGICQGAMVLEDVAVGNMSIDSMLKVTRPKVLGSIHMDELFQTDDLEFFILFSSVSSILGNIGQANYGAGNMFMSSLAERRRRRGLSASVMHIGPISGAGYISDRGLDSHFHKMSLRKAASLMSERDFFQHFAEAVMAGRPESNSPDITSGLARVESAREIGPLLSHMVIQQASQEDTGAQAKPKASLRSQLLEVRASNELEPIIREALLSRLSVVFQMELSAYSQTQCSMTRLDEMGTDSLMAIDIRSWFVKELQVNIPVLKILSGVTISDLIATAVETIPNSLVPKLSDEQRLGPKMATEMDMEDGAKTPATDSFTSKDSDSGSATLTEPTPFLGDQDPVELLFEKGSLTSPTNEQVPNVSTAASLNDSAPASLVTSPHSKPDHSAECSTQLKEAGLMNQLSDVADEKVLELSFSQSLFYFSAAFAVNPTHLNLTSAYRMTGTLCVQSMKDAVLALGSEHESLRTRFFVENSRPMQAVMKSSLLRLEHYTIQHESELETYVNDIHSHVYDLERGDTMRLAVVSTSEGRNFVIMGTHHLSMDGQSALPFMKGLMEHYTGTPTNYGTRPLQYLDMSEKQHADFRLGRFEKELTYWKNELANPPPPLPMMRISSLVSRPVLRDYGNRHWNVRIGLETKKKILLLCRRYRVTPFHFYLAIYRVLIYRYTGAEEFAIGIGDANRTEECMMESIGAFVNVLPILLRTDSQQQFDAILTETRSKTHAALEHSRLPFHLLLSE